MNYILTIGHSTHELDYFLHLVTTHHVTAIADVRSVPASRFTPQFNRDALKRALLAFQRAPAEEVPPEIQAQVKAAVRAWAAKNRR